MQAHIIKPCWTFWGTILYFYYQHMRIPIFPIPHYTCFIIPNLMCEKLYVIILITFFLGTNDIIVFILKIKTDTYWAFVYFLWILHPFVNQVVFLLLNYKNYFYFWFENLSPMLLVVFHFLDVILWCTNTFNFYDIHLSIFLVLYFTFCIVFKKSLPNLRS